MKGEALGYSIGFSLGGIVVYFASHITAILIFPAIFIPISIFIIIKYKKLK